MKLLSLILIEAVAFLLVMGETYLFFAIIVPLGAIPHNFGEFTVLAAAKVALTFGLVVLWYLVMLGLTRLYVRSKLLRRPAIPSS